MFVLFTAESLPPVLEHGPPPHQLYNAGKTIDLRCKARPPPPDQGPHQYEWFRNGNKIEESDRYQFHSQEGDSSLRISTPRDQNDAEPVEEHFQCKVSNEAGTAMSNVSQLKAAGKYLKRYLKFYFSKFEHKYRVFSLKNFVVGTQLA